MKRSARAIWEGSLKQGHGSISTDSEALQDVQYTFATRFENRPGTNPEELIAAAHSACFSMALAHELKSLGAEPQKIHTHCTISFDQSDGSWEVTGSHLEVEAAIRGIERDNFDAAVQAAKSNCPISRLLHIPITVNANLGIDRSRFQQAEKTKDGEFDTPRETIYQDKPEARY